LVHLGFISKTKGVTGHQFVLDKTDACLFISISDHLDHLGGKVLTGYLAENVEILGPPPLLDRLRGIFSRHPVGFEALAFQHLGKRLLDQIVVS
jgi:hypothetical protein